METVAHSHTRATLNGAQIAVLVAAVLQILTPLMPQLGIGEPIGSQSDSVQTLITPAGWAFSIWGALYTGSILFAIYQALPRQRNNPLIAQLRWPAAGAFLGNALWAAYTQVWGLSAVSVAIIVWTLACLLLIYRRFAHARLSAGERWFAFLPLSALAGWLTVATVVNIAASLQYHGIEGGNAGPLIAAAVVVVAGLIAGAALARGRGNLPYALVLLWGLLAICADGGQTAAIVAMATGVAAVLVIGGYVVGARRASAPGAITG